MLYIHFIHTYANILYYTHRKWLGVFNAPSGVPSCWGSHEMCDSEEGWKGHKSCIYTERHYMCRICLMDYIEVRV